MIIEFIQGNYKQIERLSLTSEKIWFPKFISTNYIELLDIFKHLAGEPLSTYIHFQGDFMKIAIVGDVPSNLFKLLQLQKEPTQFPTNERLLLYIKDKLEEVQLDETK